MANITNLQLGVSLKRQADLVTPVTAPDLVRIKKNNADFFNVACTNEDDKSEIGSGLNQAGALFPVVSDANGSLEKVISSEMACWAMVFGAGKGDMSNVVLAVDGTGTKYTVTDNGQAPSTDDLLPSFTVVEKLGSYVNRALIGNVVDNVAFKIASGPGRNTASMTVGIAGSGKVDLATALVPPTSLMVLNELKAGSAAITINGIDLVTNKSLLSLDFGMQNNLRGDTPYYIGCGTDANGYMVKGQMERGDPTYNLSFTAKLKAGSTELTKLTTRATGTAVITLTGTTPNKLQWTFQQVGFTAVQLGNSSGLVTVQVNCNVMAHATNGVMTFVGTCSQPLIGTLAA